MTITSLNIEDGSVTRKIWGKQLFRRSFRSENDRRKLQKKKWPLQAMMVDFKLLLDPPVSAKFDLLRRRCRKTEKRRSFTEIAGFGFVTGCGGIGLRRGTGGGSRELGEGLIGGEESPHFKKKNLTAFLCASIFLIAAIVIILGCTTGWFSKIAGKSGDGSEEILVPPNPVKELPPSASKLRVYGKAAVCSDSSTCAEIGRNILKRNGSAVDATLAAMFCNGVVTMQSMGLGGGFLMTIYNRNESKAYSLNAREKAPLASTNELYAADAKLSQSGPLSIAVPGELKGYWAAHQRFGKLPWKDLVQPAVEVCENGFEISNHQAMAISKNNLIINDSNFKEWFTDENGNIKKAGSNVIPKQLCETLKIIARDGSDALYNGTLTDGFLKDIKTAGGIVNKSDLLGYNIEWQEPISVKFSNNDSLYTAPPPGSGALLGFMLNILDGYNFSRESIDGIDNSVLTYHRLIEAFKWTYAKRTELGDLNFNNLTELLQNLQSRQYADEVRLKIKDNSTSQNPEDYGGVFFTNDDHGTSHISVLAENGDAVSVTSSVNIYFGAGLTSKSTGILFTSSMDDFSFPTHKNFFGLPGSPNNKMEPGKRPLSSMAPSIIVDENGQTKMVVGAAGGTKITTTIAQVAMRVLWFDQNVKEAVDAPRIHHQLMPMIVEYEYGTLQQIVDGLKALGHKVARNTGSTVCALHKDGDKIIGNSDHRKGGDVHGII